MGRPCRRDGWMAPRCWRGFAKGSSSSRSPRARSHAAWARGGPRWTTFAASVAKVCSTPPGRLTNTAGCRSSGGRPCEFEMPVIDGIRSWGATAARAPRRVRGPAAARAEEIVIDRQARSPAPGSGEVEESSDGSGLVASFHGRGGEDRRQRGGAPRHPRGTSGEGELEATVRTGIVAGLPKRERALIERTYFEGQKLEQVAPARPWASPGLGRVASTTAQSRESRASFASTKASTQEAGGGSARRSAPRASAPGAPPMRARWGAATRSRSRMGAGGSPRIALRRGAGPLVRGAAVGRVRRARDVPTRRRGRRGGARGRRPRRPRDGRVDRAVRLRRHEGPERCSMRPRRGVRRLRRFPAGRRRGAGRRRRGRRFGNRRRFAASASDPWASARESREQDADLRMQWFVQRRSEHYDEAVSLYGGLSCSATSSGLT